MLFRDVQLQPGDDPTRLQSLGLPCTQRRGKIRFDQPCAALDGCVCRVYPERPQYCRQFECALFKSVGSGATEFSAAQRIVRLAHRRAKRVQRLLAALGDQDEHRALSVRCRRTSRRLESAPLDDATAEVFGELTLAAHALNVLLQEAFYPGSASKLD